jgi:hypothetical protein|uniref:Uncharacterized protein n=1 Tax=viral metagenome TaxID=1070528 RepID=A0A6C0LVG1_9ZZZZ
MDIRIHERNRINLEIKELSGYNETDESKLTRFKGMRADDLYVQTQLEKLNKNIVERTDTLTILTDRLHMLDNGELDSELKNLINTNTLISNTKGVATKQRKKEEKASREEDVKTSKEYYNNSRKHDKESKGHIYKSSTRHFFRACDSIPEYMKINLKKMPSNTGFVWKSVYCWGERNPDSSTEYTMTENRKGFKIITKWNKTHIRVYEKTGRENMILKSENLRRIKS